MGGETEAVGENTGSLAKGKGQKDKTGKENEGAQRMKNEERKAKRQHKNKQPNRDLPTRSA